MAISRRFTWVRLLPLLLFLPGCSFLNDALWPSLAGQEPEATQPVPVERAVEEPQEEADATIDIEQSLDSIEHNLVSLTGRVELHEELFQRRQDALVEMSRGFDFVDDAPLSSDEWLDAQFHVSRLSAALIEFDSVRSALASDTGRAAAQFSNIRRLSNRTGLIPEHQTRLDQLGEAANVLISRLGDIDARMTEDFSRYDAFVSATTQRIEAAQPAKLVLEVPDTPSKPKAEEEAPEPEPLGPQNSGDRFAGRKPLAVLRYPDVDSDPTPQLRALMDRVKAQYPDIAFDLESLDAPEAGVGAVISVLDEFAVDATLFIGVLGPNETPTVKLYPR